MMLRSSATVFSSLGLGVCLATAEAGETIDVGEAGLEPGEVAACSAGAAAPGAGEAEVRLAGDASVSVASAAPDGASAGMASLGAKSPLLVSS